MKSKVLLKFEDNWADEIDICSWQIVEKEDFELARDRFLENYKDREYSICIGTNEEIEYCNAEKFLSVIEVIDISDEEESVIIKVFGTSKMTSPVNIFRRIQEGGKNYE